MSICIEEREERQKYGFTGLAQAERVTKQTAAASHKKIESMKKEYKQTDGAVRSAEYQNNIKNIQT